MTNWDEAPDEEGGTGVPADERVLVAVVPDPRDWERLRAEGWYRIPLSRAPQRIGAQYLAFYHTARFTDLRWTITYYAPIIRYRLLPRRELLPDEPDHPRADALYYKVELGPLEALPHPIVSEKLRRVTFIMTTLSRLLRAREINDLWERETARDKLYRALQGRHIAVERDYLVEEACTPYRVDLAVRCVAGNLGILCTEDSDRQIAEAGRACVDAGLSNEEATWVVQQFPVGEIMSDVGDCVQRVQAFVAHKGGQVAGGEC